MNFYQKLNEDEDIKTSQPAPGDVLDLWEKLLEDHDEIVHIAMSSGLSSSCATAAMLADDYDGKVQVVDNQRISVTQRQSVLDAAKISGRRKVSQRDQRHLRSRQIRFWNLYYGRYVKVSEERRTCYSSRSSHRYSAFGIKPVLQIHGEKLDAFCEDKRCQTGKEKDDRSSKKRV